MATMHLYLFGHLEALGSQGTTTAPLRPRAQRLLVHLLLHRHRALTREQIAFTLFPDLTEPNALATLRRALNDVRAAFSALTKEAWILSDSGALRWNPNASYWLDIQEFEQLLQDATPSALYNAVALYRGDLVRELDDEWILGERERFRQLQMGALQKLAAHHRALGEFTTALDCARKQLALDPFAEAAHREMIALQYEMGDRAAALAHYERVRAQLRDELGVEPMEETRALIAAITQGAPLTAPLSTPTVRANKPHAPREVLGRDAEMTELRTLWERAAARQGSVVLVSGEAGIGKSHLAQAFAERVSAQGGLALTGYCFGFEQALPYQPILEMLRAAANLLRRAELQPMYRAALARVAPDVLGAFGNPADPEVVPGELRAQFFEALTQSFLALARNQPLLLIIEDAHWAAESTLDWLLYLAPHLRAHGLLVLITHRAGEIEMERALANLEERLRRTSAVSLLRLKPLSREANRALVVQLSRLPEVGAQAIADRLYDQSAGNPFFVQELARGMIEAGQIKVHAGQWTGALVQAPTESQIALPNSLRATINARVERLTERARSFLRVAAVAGRVFDHILVQRAGDWDDELALAAVEELLARNFFREGDHAAQFYFTHHLVQDALYVEMTAPRRAYLHRRLADAIQQLRPNDFEALAHHWLRAGALSNALYALRQQAQRAMAVYAYGDALRVLEQASDMAASLRQTSDVDAAMIEQEIQLLLERAALIDSVGRPLDEYQRVVQAAGVLLQEFPSERLQAQYYLRQAELLSQMAHYERAAEAAQQAYHAFRALQDPRGAARGIYLAGINKLTLSAYPNNL